MIKCSKCGKELKDGYAFCIYCGNKIEKEEKVEEEIKEEKVEEKVEEEIKEEKVEEPVKEEVTSEEPVEEETTKEKIDNPVKEEVVEPVKEKRPKKKGRWKTILVTLFILLLIAAVVVLSILLLKKDEEKSNKNESTSSYNKEDKKEDKKEEKTTIVGDWEHTLNVNKDGELYLSVYEHFKFTKDGSFEFEKYDKKNKSDRMELEGTYKVKNNNKIIITYEYDDEEEETAVYLNDGKLCIEDSDCEEYFVKKGSGKNSTFTYDADDIFGDEDDYDEDDDELDTNIDYIDYDEYKAMLKGKESFVMVVVQEGCAHCKRFSPVVKKLADNYITPIYYYEYDRNIDVKVTPTTFIIIDGEIEEKVEGYKDYDSMEEIYDNIGLN